MKQLQEVVLKVKDGKITETEKVGTQRGVADSIADMKTIDTTNAVKKVKGEKKVKGWIEIEQKAVAKKAPANKVEPKL